MQHLLLFRALSHVGFRLGIGGALLLGSVGLTVGISLLSYAYTYERTAAPAAWKSPAKTALTSFDLSRYGAPKVPLIDAAPATKASLPLTGTAAYQGSTISQPPQRLAPSSSRAEGATLDSTSISLRRSWATIKAMFR